MRASCETDWLDSGMAPHVVAKWIGHNVDTQNRHYAEVDNHRFDQFNAEAEKVAHYVAHKSCEVARNQNRAINVFAGFLGLCSPRVTPQGLEPQLTEPESVVLPITPRGRTLLQLIPATTSM